MNKEMVCLNALNSTNAMNDRMIFVEAKRNDLLLNQSSELKFFSGGD